ncbi:hypothetical protein Enr17x_09280 [Gimesia fumaroli]|uniref:Uncharacterized protein n=1 Tax=Gimesia fumaroli TaxID=2527976 RepID=A0A518I740_9PLAN|nr:hypothetical protein Enr17x_09280 [Gimesia fumaroli]
MLKFLTGNANRISVIPQSAGTLHQFLSQPAAVVTVLFGSSRVSSEPLNRLFDDPIYYTKLSR